MIRSMAGSLVLSNPRSLVVSDGAPPEPHPLYANLLEFWPLDESSGAALGEFAGNDLAAVNSPTASATGSPRSTQCRSYSASQYHSGSIANPASNAITLWYWTRPTGGAQPAALVASGSPSQRIMGTEWISDTLYLYNRDTAGNTRNTTAAMVGSAWHLVVQIWDGATGLCYYSIDGAARVQIGTAFANPLGAWDTMTIGGIVGYAPGNSREWMSGLCAGYAATDGDCDTLYSGGQGLTLAELAALTA